MTERISGGSFDVNYDSIMIHVENATVTITDNSAVAQSRGIPNGHTKGSVSADVEVEVDSQNFKKFTAVARAVGSGEPFLQRTFCSTPTPGTTKKNRGVWLRSDAVRHRQHQPQRGQQNHEEN